VVQTLLLDAGYDNGDLLADCARLGIEVLAPLSKPIGKATAQDRRDRAAYPAWPWGEAGYKQRGYTIEPFFAPIKDFFHLDPLPLQSETNASVLILLALYAWNLIVLFNFVHDRPLGAVKPVLDVRPTLSNRTASVVGSAAGSTIGTNLGEQSRGFCPDAADGSQRAGSEGCGKSSASPRVGSPSNEPHSARL